MNKMLSLFLMLVNKDFGITKFRVQIKNRNRLWEPVVIVMAIIAASISFITLIWQAFGLFYKIVEGINQEPLFLNYIITAAAFLVFILGFFYIISTLYMSNDVIKLIPLPLSPYQILGAKYMATILVEYLALTIFLLPGLIFYGIKSTTGIIYWVYGMLIYLFLPVIPLALATIVVVITMRLVNLSKHKNLWQVVAGLTIFSLIILFQFVFNIFSSGKVDPTQIQELLNSQDSLLRMVSKNYPPGLWATMSLIESNSAEGLSWLIYFLLLSVVAFIFMLWLGNKFYFKGLIGSREISRKRVDNSNLIFIKFFNKKRNGVLAIFYREWFTYIRTPDYLLNSIAVIIMPVVFLIFTTYIPDINIKGIITTLDNYYIILLFVIWGALLPGLGTLASTAFSREGTDFYISKIIPLSPVEQVRGKQLHNLSFGFVGIFVVLLAVNYLIKLGVVFSIFLLFISMLSSITTTNLLLFVDMKRPLLDWENTQQAIKRNLNSLLGMVISSVWVIFLAAIYFMLYQVAGRIEILIVLVGLMIISSYFSDYLLKISAVDSFNKIEL